MGREFNARIRRFLHIIVSSLCSLSIYVPVFLLFLFLSFPFSSIPLLFPPPFPLFFSPLSPPFVEFLPPFCCFHFSACFSFTASKTASHSQCGVLSLWSVFGDFCCEFSSLHKFPLFLPRNRVIHDHRSSLSSDGRRKRRRLRQEDKYRDKCPQTLFV